MVNVTLTKERVWTKVKGDFIFGSILVNGGKDQYGKPKPNGFVDIKFSNEAQDDIYNGFDGEIPEVIEVTGKGFMSWNEYNGKGNAVIVINDLNAVKEYVKEETPKTKQNHHEETHHDRKWW